MNIYLVLLYLAGGSAIVGVVHLVKSHLSDKFVDFFVMVISALISLVVVMAVYKHVDVLGYGGSTGALYLLSQVFYKVGKVLFKWFTQKEPLTTQEVEQDTAQVAQEVAQEVPAA